jgi:hypothetical protein
LRKGRTQSCGCGVNPIKFFGDEASLRELYRDYRDGAKKRALVFELTIDDFRKLTSSDCVYCGAKPNKLARARKGTRVHYVYNGVDRRENQSGYSKENCSPCCSTCNHMKCQMSISDFLAHIRRIAGFSASEFD